MAIDFQHKDYKAQVAAWTMIDDVCNMRDVEKYLIELNPTDTSVENRERNAAYKKRAVFYQVAGYTVRGLNSLLFAKEPEFVAPAQLEYLADNADGSGVSIYQQAQAVAREVIMKSRAGLYVTYPKTDAPASRADMAAMRVFATIHKIDAEQVVNWRVEMVGAQIKLTLVVIKEVEDELQPDGHEVKSVDQYRELAMVNGVFVVRKWRQNAKKEWAVVDESIPVDGSGKSWDVIPFTFVGAEDNSSSVDTPNMLALATINVAHYRNSADYEDSVWFAGQAQPWMSGMTQTHVDMMKKNNMYVGSRNCLGVPQGETFSFATAPANPLVRQAMIDKQDQMIGIGARFIQPTGPAKTATEAGNDAQVQHSVLSLISSNLSEAYTLALQWCARYMNVDAGDAEFETTQDFVSPTATSQEIQAMAATFLQGAMPMGDYYRWLKKRDLIDPEKTVEEFSQEVGAPNMPDLDANDAAAA